MKSRSGQVLSVGALAGSWIALMASAMAYGQTGTTTFLLKDPTGDPGQVDVGRLDASADGRYVAIEGTIDFPDYPWGVDLLHVLDRRTGAYEIASLTWDGQASLYCTWPALSADGRILAFQSYSQDLVPQSLACTQQGVFVRDLESDFTELISITPAGNGACGVSVMPSVSADGRFVAFVSNSKDLIPFAADTHGVWWYQVFVRDRLLRQTELISVSIDGHPGSGGCISPAVSDDGRFVAFASGAKNLVADDANGYHTDVFVRDRLLQTTELVSLSSAGDQGLASSGWTSSWAGSELERTVNISGDGRIVAFTTELSSRLVPLPPNCPWVEMIVVARDRHAVTTELVSVSDRGELACDESTGPVLSEDGRYVTFISWGKNLSQPNGSAYPSAFLRDRLEQRTMLINQTSAGSSSGSKVISQAISADGRQVFFSSDGWFSPSDTKVGGGVKLYVHDLRAPSPWFSCAQPENPWCDTTLRSYGHPSRSAGEGFWVIADDTPKKSWSQFVYGLAAQVSIPFSAGQLCVPSPWSRMGKLNRNQDNPFNPHLCLGWQFLDAGRFLESGEDPALVPGVTVHLQCVVSVPPDVSPAGTLLLTPSVVFTIQP